jgi:hypothetical protein
LEEAFTWQGLPAPAQEDIGEIRELSLELASAIKDLVPVGEAQTEALRRLKESMMWANLGVSLGHRHAGPAQSPHTVPPVPEVGRP